MSENLLKTDLYDLHEELGAKLVSFAGYALPLQFAEGVIKEHLITRTHAGLFDVSHMGQIVIKGEGVTQALEKLLPVDLCQLNYFQHVYTVLTNEQGGILDDLIVARWHEDEFFLVVNAAGKEKDIEYLRQQLPETISIKLLSDRALLALQGPASRAFIKQFVPEAATLNFMTGRHSRIEGVDCYVTCSGYTGEDGFELSIPVDKADVIARRLLGSGSVKPVGLGARDSLRLEAGLCLHGQDITAEITPVEAGLQWTISKSRRAGGHNAGGFPGADIIFQQMCDGVNRKRVGLNVQGRVPAREGSQLIGPDDKLVGVVTSGGFSPSTGAPIAMAYVEQMYSGSGTRLNAMVRGKAHAVTVSRTPFVPHNYYRIKH